MKPGRNDPCPCGSGKKYKHCCLRKADVVSEEEAHWRRVRRALEPLNAELLREAKRRLSADDLDFAWADFNIDDEVEPFDPGARLAQAFLSWWLYNWRPGDPDAPEEPTVAESLLAHAAHRLDPIARRYVEACLATPFSFHEVIDCRPGEGMRLRDVMLGAEANVSERAASRNVQVGDCLFAKLVPVDGLTLIEALGSTAIAPAHKPMLIELRRTLGTRDSLFGVETLREYADTLRETYLDIDEMARGAPELRNTDGDVLEFHTLIYDLDAPEEALERLEDLGGGIAEATIERDDTGRLARAEIVWSRRGNSVHADWDNTTLGTLRIEGTRLTAEVNSAERAAALRTLIGQRLGDSARALPDVVQSAQSLMEHGEETLEQARGEPESEELAALPEVQAAMQEFLRAHYRRWLDDKLPALGNRSPRKAVRTPDGREAVMALMAQIERDGVRMHPPLDPDIVRELRATLGLG